MRFYFAMFSILVSGLFACKPASFRSIDTSDAAAEQPVESQDAVAETSGAVLDEAIEATEITSTEIKLQPPETPPAKPPVTPPAPPEDLKLACADAKKNGTLKAKTIPIFFPAKTTTCEFEKNDNLSRKNEVLRARREESVELPLQGVTRLCNMKFDAAKQNMKFDDEILITLNQFVVASSQDYSVKSKNKNDQLVYPNGFSVDNDGLVTYKWLPPNGLQNLEYFNGKLSKYCLGLDPKNADFEQLCSIPKTDTNGTMQLTLPQDAFLKLAVKAGLVFDKQLQQLPKARLGFVTTGDNNDSDCQHLDFQMSVTIDYVP